MTAAVAVLALACVIGAYLTTRRSTVGLPASESAQASPELLRMPFEEGVVVWLMQGPKAPPGHTHRLSLPQNTEAIDFATPLHDVVYVVAAAAGRVSYVYRDASADDVTAGAGYGNQVKVLHRDGSNTFYAHLDAVYVSVGEKVVAGQRIGTMGRTGRAGTRHLHFSLNEDGANQLGGATCVPIERLVTVDVTEGVTEFRAWRGDDLELDYSQQYRGHLYASENSPQQRPSFGAPSLELRERVVAEARKVQSALDIELRLAALARDKSDEGAWYREELDAIAAIDPDHPVTLYLRAVMVQVPSGSLAEARTTLLAAEAANKPTRRFVPWLPGRVQFQLGMLAVADGERQEARRHFQRAAELSTSRRQLDDAQRELELLGASRR